MIFGVFLTVFNAVLALFGLVLQPLAMDSDGFCIFLHHISAYVCIFLYISVYVCGFLHISVDPY